MRVQCPPNGQSWPCLIIACTSWINDGGTPAIESLDSGARKSWESRSVNLGLVLVRSWSKLAPFRKAKFQDDEVMLELPFAAGACSLVFGIGSAAGLFHLPNHLLFGGCHETIWPTKGAAWLRSFSWFRRNKAGNQDYPHWFEACLQTGEHCLSWCG